MHPNLFTPHKTYDLSTFFYFGVMLWVKMDMVILISKIYDKL